MKTSTAMEIKSKLHYVNGKEIVEVQEKHVIFTDAQQFMDITFNLPSDRVVYYKESFNEAFFDLRSGVAGEILQKASNYAIRLAIVGDFSNYESKSLKDFIYESNKSNNTMFLTTLDEALQRLSIG